jgi:hypothetical protein
MTHKREENELGDIDIKITSQQPLLWINNQFLTNYH